MIDPEDRIAPEDIKGIANVRKALAEAYDCIDQLNDALSKAITHKEAGQLEKMVIDLKKIAGRVPNWQDLLAKLQHDHDDET